MKITRRELRKIIKEELKELNSNDWIPDTEEEIEWRQFWPKVMDTDNKLYGIKGWSRGHNIEFKFNEIDSYTINNSDLEFEIKWGDLALNSNKVSKIVRERDGYHFTMDDRTIVVIDIKENSISNIGKEIEFEQIWPKIVKMGNSLNGIKVYNKNNTIKSMFKVISSKNDFGDLIFTVKGDFALNAAWVSEIIKKRDGYHIIINDGTTIVMDMKIKE